MRQRIRTPILLLGVLTLVSPRSLPIVADEPPSSTLRVRGVIDKDQTWANHVLLTGDVTIDGAKVTVAAGTTIEFAQAEPGAHPTLTVGSPIHRGGKLDLQSTPDRPITIRTQPQTNPGRLIVYVRGERPTTSAPVVPAKTPAPVGGGQNWRYVTFEDLGFANTSPAIKGRRGLMEPAVMFYVLEADAPLTIANCVFENTTDLTVDSRVPAKIGVTANRFVAPKSRIAVDVEVESKSASPEAAEISGNHVAGGIHARGPSVRISDNVLIGLDASIVVEESPAADVRITGNYIHNTTKDDDGRYCLNCEAADALIEGNVFRGGTTCVLSGSRRFSGNVVIAQGELASRAVRRAHTHQLVSALPAGAVFDRNLLIGPAYSMLIPQAMPGPADRSAGNSPTVIRNNVFDGLNGSTRAIHANPLDRAPGTFRVENNLFLRVPTLVYDEAQGRLALAYADYNAAAPPPRRPFDRVVISGLKEGQEGWGAHDVRAADIAKLRLTSGPDQPPDDDAEIAAGKLKVAALREKLFRVYRPLPDSPLVGAGRAESNDAAKRPSIGAGEPTAQ